MRSLTKAAVETVEEEDAHHRVVDVMVSRGLRSAHEISADASVLSALRLLTERRVGSALVVREKKIEGVFTARDVLHWLHRRTDQKKWKTLAIEALQAPVEKISTSAGKVAWCSPRDPLTRVRVVMRALGVRNLPVVCTTSGAVLGLLTANDVADYSLEKSSDVTSLGGKDAFLKATHGRTGLPSGAAVVDSETRKTIFAAIQSDDDAEEDFIKEHPKLYEDDDFIEERRRPVSPVPRQRLRFDVGACAVPNPLKFPDGSLANSRRDKVEAETVQNDDPDLSEDAYFLLEREKQFVGVFDGVGSWRKLGVDPRRYPRALRDAVVEAITRTPHERPHDVLTEAWRRVTADKVPGSTTACIVTLDDEVNALSYVNLGDAGIVVFRDIDASHAGTTVGLQKKRQVVLVAPQQLRDFNLPYQLGWTNAYDDKASSPEEDPGAVRTFETPSHANVASFPVQPGDVVIVASDGLFDNVFLDHIADLVSDWDDGNKDLTALATHLCHTARSLSLHDDTDSPFALLAKENDIMWGGGMPDDCTVLALRVVNADDDDDDLDNKEKPFFQR